MNRLMWLVGHLNIDRTSVITRRRGPRLLFSLAVNNPYPFTSAPQISSAAFQNAGNTSVAKSSKETQTASNHLSSVS